LQKAGHRQQIRPISAFYCGVKQRIAARNLMSPLLALVQGIRDFTGSHGGLLKFATRHNDD